MKTLCIYHANCADGFAAAWVVRRALGDAVEFYPGVYGEDPPEVTGRLVILVDFSYPRAVLEGMIQRAIEVVILDHHKSAEHDLHDLRRAIKVFDMNRSGARITWDFFFPSEPPPQLLLHIEDRDLWRFALPNTRQIQANLFSYPYDFAVWDTLMASDVTSLIAEGSAIERKHFKDLTELLPAVTRPMIIDGHQVNVANLPYIFTSDAALMLAKDKAFGACYWDTPTGRSFSLRSETEGGADVSEIARKFGGGGHKHAAGFRVSFAQAREFETCPA